jgi:hypothetical protein
MEKETIRQLRGLNALIAEAVDAGVVRTQKIHRSIAGYPYAALTSLPPLAAPVRAVEVVETTISGTVYWSVRLVARVSGAAVSRVLEHLDAREP